MFLLIDAGNSRVKWALADAGHWHADGAFEHAHLADLKALAAAHAPLARVLCANVAGAGVASAIAEAVSGQGAQPEWLQASSQCCGVENLYETPSQLGADRWAALIGARALQPGASLVVMAGTATTIDVLDADGRFQGGVILPGLALMGESLHRNTAQLPPTEGRYVALPRCTADAIASGCLAAQVGAVEHLFRRIDRDDKLRCLLSGGGAAALADHLAIPVRRIDNLVLRGLAIVCGVAPAAIAANSGAIR